MNFARFGTQLAQPRKFHLFVPRFLLRRYFTVKELELFQLCTRTQFKFEWNPPNAVIPPERTLSQTFRSFVRSVFLQWSVTWLPPPAAASTKEAEEWTDADGGYVAREGGREDGGGRNFIFSRLLLSCGKPDSSSRGELFSFFLLSSS